jgi:hypothetical protein
MDVGVAKKNPQFFYQYFPHRKRKKQKVPNHSNTNKNVFLEEKYSIIRINRNNYKEYSKIVS